MSKIRKMLVMTSEISTASMSDIAFLLIIFFMIASVFTIRDGLHLVLPDKDKKPVIRSSQEVITITVQNMDRVLLEKKPVPLKDLERELALLNDGKKKYVLLNIEKNIKYHRAVEIVDIIKFSGFDRLSIKMI